MTMGLGQVIITIGMVVLGTMITRFLPFIIFPANKPIPKYIKYLGQVLPFAVIGMLVVYCLKNTTVTSMPYGLPEAIAIICIIILHCLKRNMLLSIGGGTLIYMVLVQLVFV